MRVVVADATPLHYLILIDVVQVLPRLFEKIHVPIEVGEELSCEATPPIVRTWMEQPPQWLEVLAAPVVAPKILPFRHWTRVSERQSSSRNPSAPISC